MSDLAAAASAAGVPEELVMRSAQARAQAAGVSADEILSAWAGGGSAPAGGAPAPAVEPAPAEAVESSPEPEPIEEAPAAPAPTEAAASAAVDGPVVVVDQRVGAAPILTGRKDPLWLYVAGIALLFAVGAVVAVALPAADARAVAAEQIPGTTPQLSQQAIDGRQIYLQEGCFYCHTQQVRSVVTDVGLGPVTEPGTSPALAVDTFGFQRIGPDLTHVASREPTDDAIVVRTYLRDPLGVLPDSNHPSYAYLSDEDLDSVVQYLIESK